LGTATKRRGDSLDLKNTSLVGQEFVRGTGEKGSSWGTGNGGGGCERPISQIARTKKVKKMRREKNGGVGVTNIEQTTEHEGGRREGDIRRQVQK